MSSEGFQERHCFFQEKKGRRVVVLRFVCSPYSGNLHHHPSSFDALSDTQAPTVQIQQLIGNSELVSCVVTAVCVCVCVCMYMYVCICVHIIKVGDTV